MGLFIGFWVCLKSKHCFGPISCQPLLTLPSLTCKAKHSQCTPFLTFTSGTHPTVLPSKTWLERKKEIYFHSPAHVGLSMHHPSIQGARHWGNTVNKRAQSFPTCSWQCREEAEIQQTGVLLVTEHSRMHSINAQCSVGHRVRKKSSSCVDTGDGGVTDRSFISLYWGMIYRPYIVPI